MIKKTTIINEQTGEKYSEREVKFTPAFDEEKGYLFWARRGYVKSFHEMDFPEEMNDLDIGRMARLAKLIWASTNMLGYRGNGGVKPYSIDMIAEILKMEPRQTYRFIEKMIRLGVMARVRIDTENAKETHLYINPIYFFSSNRIPLNLYLIFSKQLDKVLPAWVREEFRRKRG